MTCDQRTLVLCRGASWALLSSLVPAVGLDLSWVHRLAHRGAPLSKSLPKNIALEPSRPFSKNRQHHLYVLLNPLTLSHAEAADRTPQHVRRAATQYRSAASDFNRLFGNSVETIEICHRGTY
ncbi:hypothetical protein DFH06DRAFT_1293799 [Mycena polygramma]|nr:hypothetical protein DFH06DRAFT_1293768 [Mycena polygramma]KAJ7670915.1 hypothetical protein DFH06DRAFT_1293799 [Mycena polygramma]